MGKLARTGVFCLMGLAICLARLVEVEFKSETKAPPAATIGAEPTPTPPAHPVGPADSVVAVAPVAPVAAQGISPKKRTYVVRKGDQLGKISKRVYGTTKHWKAIYDANRTVIKSPKALKVGATLVIPPKPGA